jgi:hypothetical protein
MGCANHETVTRIMNPSLCYDMNEENCVRVLWYREKRGGERLVYITREWRLLWAYCHLCNHRICNAFGLYTGPAVPRLRNPYLESHSLGLATSPPAILLNFVIFTGKNHGFGVAVVACMACMARVEGLLGATQFRVEC